MASRFAIVLAVFLVAAGCVQFTPEYMGGTEYEKARFLYERGLLDLAKEKADSVAEGEPHYKEARELAREIDVLSRRLASRHQEIAEEYLAAGIPAVAVKEFEIALGYDPGNEAIYKKLAEARKSMAAGMGVPSGGDEAEDKGDDASGGLSFGKGPGGEKARARYERGRELFGSGEYRLAAEEFYAVLEVDPDNREARAYLNLAEAELERALELHMKRGISYFQKEEMDLAIKEWDRVLELDPGNTEASEYKSRAEAVLKRWKKIRDKQNPREGKAD